MRIIDIDLLTRKDKPDKGNSPIGFKERKQYLKKSVDPIGHETIINDSDYDLLANKYKLLSRIVHHVDIINEEDARSHLDAVSTILKKLLQSQLSIHNEVDQIIAELPSLENAEKLKSFGFTLVTLEHIVDNLSENWLPFMYKSNFFEKPYEAIVENNKLGYPNWPPSTYLIKCTKKKS